jgi:hypothetical protein
VILTLESSAVEATLVTQTPLTGTSEEVFSTIPFAVLHESNSNSDKEKKRNLLNIKFI